MNQEEQVVKFETAKLAKEKGFAYPTKLLFTFSLTERVDEEDGKSGPFGWENNELSVTSGYFINNRNMIDFSSDSWYMCSAPTQSHLQKWLRDKHHINVFVGYRANIKKWDSHSYNLNLNGKEYVEERSLKKFREQPVYDTYEDALEEGLKNALKNLKMEEQVVSFETAKLANEKGFDVKINRFKGVSYYNYKGELNGDAMMELKHRKDTPNKFKSIVAPTQSLLQKWLRDKYDIDIVVIPYSDNENYGYHWQRFSKNPGGNISGNPTDGETYEIALEDCLLKTLKLI